MTSQADLFPPPAPTSGSLKVEVDRPFVSRTRESGRYLVLRLVAPRGQEGPRMPVSISLVLDRSGSMGGGKFDLARKAVDHALARLEPRDTFSVVVFDDHVDTIMSQVQAHPEAIAEAGRRLRAVGPRGSTDLCRGWLTGCGEVARQVTDKVVGRALLLTDGLANVGETVPEALTTHATELRKRGVSTSTFGVGRDFDEGLLGQMADAGGGVFHFIEDARKIPALIATELGETLDVVARDVVVEITLPQGVRAHPVGRFTLGEPAPDTAVRSISLPDLVSRQEVELALRLEIPPSDTESRVQVQVSARDRTGALGRLAAEATFLYAGEDTVLEQEADDAVVGTVVRKETSFAREEALLLNKQGRLQGARERLQRSASSLGELSRHSVVASKAAQDMDLDSERMVHPMAPEEIKSEYYQSSQISRGFDPTGKRKKA